MSEFRKAENLGQLADKLKTALGARGRRRRGPRAVTRHKGQAPTMAEWAASHGLDVAWLDASQQDGFASAFRRCMESALGDAFWDSNHTTLYNLPHHHDCPAALGGNAHPVAIGGRDAVEMLRRSPPGTFADLAGILKGAAEAKAGGEEGLYRPTSHKSKSGNRTALQAPTFEQWAIKCGIRLTKVPATAIAAARPVFLRLMDAYLKPWFGKRHAQLGEAGGVQSQTRAVGGSSRGAAGRRGAAPGSDKLADWLKAKFVDYDPEYMHTFLQHFPTTDPAAVIQFAATWDQKDPEGKYSNFKRFLRRAGATFAAAKAGNLPLPQAQDWVFLELNPAFEAVAALVKEKGGGVLEPLQFAAEIEVMPMLLKTTRQDLKQILDDVRARNLGTDLPVANLLQQVARRVQMGRGPGTQPKPLQDLVQGALRDAAAGAAERALGLGGAGRDPYSKPAGGGYGGGQDTLHALRNQQFKLQSTKEMVDRAIRLGSEPQAQRGTTWVLADGHGGGEAANHATNMDGLVRDIVNQIVAEQTVPQGHGQGQRHQQGQLRYR